ncbi:MAG: thioesterase family protein [Saccharospirillum sp.]|nr:thioesterase family protein [Saccharospirillum sp.]
MNIDALFEQALAAGQIGSMAIPDSWGQGRTAFGGLTAALAYRVLRTQVEQDRMLRSLSVSFVAPIATDVPFSFESTCLRQGKNVTQAQASIIQEGQVGVTLLASFGVARESRTGVNNTETPDVLMPEQPQFLPFIPQVTPQFFQHVDLVLCSGSFPFTGAKTAHHGGFMRFSEPPAEMTDAHVIALIDSWPPTLLQQLSKPAPASTLAWNLEFLHPHRPVLPQDWFAYQADTRQAGEGYGHTEASIWDAHGELIAISRQTVTVFA